MLLPSPSAGFQGSSELTALTYNCLPIRNFPGYISSRFFPQLFICPFLAKTWNLPGSSRFFPQLFTCSSLAETQNEITITWTQGALFSQNGVIQGHSDP